MDGDVPDLLAGTSAEERAEALQNVKEEERRVSAVSAETRGGYARACADFLVWLHGKHPDVVNKAFGEDESGSVTRISLERALKHPSSACAPLLFDRVTSSMIVGYLVTLKKRDGTSPSFSTVSEKGVAMHMKSIGTRKKESKMALKEDNSVDALEFGDYCAVCKYFLARGMHVQHLFAILSWNLASRPRNTDMIHVEHIEWKDDSLIVYFAHSKAAGQQGRNSKQPRAIYANPTNPFICPVLSLAMYVSAYPDISEGKLFEGHSQNKRFGPALKKALGSLGLSQKKLGTLSFGKGAVSFCISTSTMGPSPASVYMRAGLSLGQVQDVYIKAEDRCVGRTICGLPVDSPLFAALPPRFAGDVDEPSRRIVNVCFPQIARSMPTVARFLTASMIYHAEWLLEELAADSPVRQAPCFLDLSYKEAVSLVTTEGSGDFRPTGIPPHIAILSRVSRAEEGVSGVAAQIVNGVIGEREERAVGSDSAITKEDVRSVMLEFLDEIRELSSPTAAEKATDTPAIVYFWGGQYHMIPEDYKLPKVTTSVIWDVWWLGNKEDGVPPLRKLKTSEWSSRDGKKRFCELRRLMLVLEAEGRTNHGMVEESMTDLSAVRSMYKKVKRVLHSTQSGKCERRSAQNSWRTVARQLGARGAVV